MNSPTKYILNKDSDGIVRNKRGNNEHVIFPTGLVSVHDKNDDELVLIRKEDAIALAKDILIFNHVSFCNRVSDGK